MEPGVGHAAAAPGLIPGSERESSCPPLLLRGQLPEVRSAADPRVGSSAWVAAVAAHPESGPGHRRRGRGRVDQPGTGANTS